MAAAAGKLSQATSAPMAKRARFGIEMVGQGLDITVRDPDSGLASTRRVRVIGFNAKRGTHVVEDAEFGSRFEIEVDVGNVDADAAAILVGDDAEQVSGSRSSSATSRARGSATSSKATTIDLAPRPVPPYGKNLVGWIVDVTYAKPRKTYRVLVIKFDQRTGFHHVNSQGLSLWDGDSFKDELNMNMMEADGLIQLVKHETSAMPAGITSQGAGLVGAVLDLRYLNPPKTYRVRVVGFDSRTQWHQVDSTGLSTWDGEAFKDTVNLAQMEAAGQVKAVQGVSTPTSRHAQVFGPEIVGQVIEVTYTSPKATYRMKVISYDANRKWHKVDSTGLSLWDGDAFKDVLDITAMHKHGQIQFLTGSQSIDKAAPVFRRPAAAKMLAGKLRPPSASKKASSARVVAKGKGTKRPAIFGRDLAGHVMDIVYGASRKKYRVRVVGYDPATGKHRVDSRLEARQGKALVENVDINAMYALGLATLVSAPEAGSGATATASASGTGRSHESSVKRPLMPSSRATKRQVVHGRRKLKGADGFGADVVGSVVDITYADPPATYRLAVKSFDERTGLHVVDSAGLSDWDGEPFVDTIDLNSMSSLGRIQFVGKDALGSHSQPAAENRPDAGKGPKLEAPLAPNPLVPAALHATRYAADTEGSPTQSRMEPNSLAARPEAARTSPITSAAAEVNSTGPGEGALADSLAAGEAACLKVVHLEANADKAVRSAAKSTADEAFAACAPQELETLEATPATAALAWPLSAALEVKEGRPESPSALSAQAAEGPPVASSLTGSPSAEAFQRTAEAGPLSKERATEQKEGVAARVARIAQEMREAKERNEPG